MSVAPHGGNKQAVNTEQGIYVLSQDYFKERGGSKKIFFTSNSGLQKNILLL